MENASKALIMAGGVLLSVIVIGLLLLAYTQLREYPKEQEAVQKAEQLAKFNTEYEAYEKERLYGTDVITVLNKAINNNIKYTDNESVYDIDVVFTLKSDVTSSATIYTPSYDENGNRDGKMDITVQDTGKLYGFQLGVVFPKDTPYSLLSNPDKDKNRINDNIEELLSMKETTRIDGENEWEYTIIDTGFKQFKRKLFACTGIEYNAETGRVKKLTFQEIDNSGADE